MDKKAVSVILLLFEVLVVVVVVFMAFKIAIGFAEDETVNKINIADDLSMMVNVLVGTPGNAVIEYPHDLSKYSIILAKDHVLVYVKESSGLGQNIEEIKRTFILPTFFLDSFVPSSIEEVDRVCLEKNNYVITLRPCTENES